MPEQIIERLIFDHRIIYSKFEFCFWSEFSIETTKKTKLLKSVFYEMLRIHKRIFICNFRVMILDKVPVNTCKNCNNLFYGNKICPDVGRKSDFQIGAAVNHKPCADSKTDVCHFAAKHV